ncbi:MAG: hypothetical protein AAFR55_00070 [Pseudomonadota bacterium]
MLAQAKRQAAADALPDSAGDRFSAVWLQRDLGELKPFPTRLLIVTASDQAAPASEVVRVVQLRRFRQEVSAIGASFGALPSAPSSDTVALAWPPHTPPDARAALSARAVACVNAAFNTQLSLAFRLLEADVDLVADSGAAAHLGAHPRDRAGFKRTARHAASARGGARTHTRTSARRVDGGDGGPEALGSHIAPAFRLGETALRLQERYRAADAAMLVFGGAGADHAQHGCATDAWRAFLLDLLFALVRPPHADAYSEAVRVLGGELAARLTGFLAARQGETSLTERDALTGCRAVIREAVPPLVAAAGRQRGVFVTLPPAAVALSLRLERHDLPGCAWLEKIAAPMPGVETARLLSGRPPYAQGARDAAHAGADAADTTHDDQLTSCLAQLAEDQAYAPLICALAVFEAPFTIRDASAVLLMTEAQLRAPLGMLADRGTLARSILAAAPAFRFDDDVLRLAALSRLSATAQRKLQQRAAEARAASWNDADALTLHSATLALTTSGHFESVGNDEQAHAWAARAGDCYAQLEKPAEAETAFAKALALLRRKGTPASDMAELETRIQIVRARHRRDRRSDRDVVSQLVRCQTLIKRIAPSPTPLAIEVHAALSEVMRERGNLARSEEALAQLQTLGSSDNVAVSQIVCSSQIMLCWHRGDLGRLLDLHRALAATKQALPARHGTPEQHILRLMYRRATFADGHAGLAHTLRHDYAPARTMLDQAIARVALMNEPMSEARILILAATAATWSGHTTTAVSLAMAAHAIAQRFQLPARGALASALITWARADQDLRRASDALATSAETLQAFRSNVNLALVHALRARTLIRLKDWPAAQEAVRSGLKAAQASGLAVYLPELERIDVIVGIESRARSSAQSSARMRKALARAREQGTVLFIGRIAKTAATYGLDVG